MSFNFGKLLKALLAFFAVLLVFVLFQGAGTAMTTPCSDKVIVYNFINYSFFTWIIQSFYWIVTTILALMAAKATWED